MKRQREDEPNYLAGLTLIGLTSAALYAAILALSRRFEYGSPGTGRPLLAVLVLFAGLFGLYLYAIWMARRTAQDRSLLGIIGLGAVGFRLIMLFSTPIQEIDIYRYLWDGAATTAGVSPFAYSPRQVLAAGSGDEVLTAGLSKLVELRDQSAVWATILDRVHFGELTTIYPPTSQAVFALATITTPSGASIHTRLVVMKLWFVVLDLGTLAALLTMLRWTGWPVGLCIIHGWCPLLMKEIAGSGHHDAVAVLLMTCSVALFIRCFPRENQPHHQQRQAAPDECNWPWWLMLSSALLLAAAVGAKLYPLVLAPAILLGWWSRQGWRRTIAAVIVFVAATSAVMAPMFVGAEPKEPRLEPSSAGPVQVVPALPLDVVTPAEAVDTGLGTFLRQWEMNDFIFLVIFENLKPTAGVPTGEIPWFSRLPETWRQALIVRCADRWDIPTVQAAFYLSRVLTSTVFLLLLSYFVRTALRVGTASAWLHALLLTVAWFWLLCPTQNPWYWTWALPLVPFARNPAWLWMSGLVMVYYLRFWLGYHWPEDSVPGTAYRGEQFFDFVVTWIEYVPWFVGLAWLARKFHPIRRALS